MALYTPANYPILSPEQANPFGYGLSQAITSRLNAANAAAQEAKNPYIGQQAAADVQGTLSHNIYQNLLNQYYPQDIQSQIGLRGAQTGLANQEAKYTGPKAISEMNLQGAQAANARQEAAKIDYLLHHPGFLGGEESKTLQSLKDMGYLDSSNQPLTQPVNNAQGNAQTNNVNNLTNTPLSNTTSTSLANTLQSTSPQSTPLVNNLTNSLQNTQSPPTSNVNPNAPFSTGRPLVDAILNKSFAAPAYQRQMTSAFDYVHSTPDMKNYDIAQLAGAGIDPSVGVHELSSGKTVPQILQEHGFDPNNPPDPDFLPTRGNIQTLKTRQAALKEIDVMGNFITKSLGPYSRTIANMPVNQISDALQGKNKQQQADFLAARMLTPEYASLRSKLANGPAGITAVEGILDKSMLDMKPIRALVSPEIWTMAQKKADDVLKSSFAKANDTYKVARQKGVSDNENTSTQAEPKITDADIAHTAKINNMSEAKVRERLKSEGRL